MNLLKALTLGTVQGLSEFLPISSSGHLSLLSFWFGLGEQGVSLAIILHVATLLSVCVVMRAQIWALIKKPFSPLALKLYLASAITFALAFLLKSTVESMFESISVLPFMFLVTAFVLAASELVSNNTKNPKPIDYKRAALIGLVQGLAVLPGISRSGSTISAAGFAKVEREEATNFSFLLSIPIILASACYELIFNLPNSGGAGAIAASSLAAAFAAAFIFGIFGILLMKKLLKKAKLWWFSVYLIILSVAILIAM